VRLNLSATEDLFTKLPHVSVTALCAAFGPMNNDDNNDVDFDTL